MHFFTTCWTLPFDLPSHNDNGKLVLNFKFLSPLVTPVVVPDGVGAVPDGVGAVPDGVGAVPVGVGAVPAMQ
jgi:hypothetical protein